MIQDILPKHLYNQYDINASIEPKDTVICFSAGDVLCAVEKELDFPTYLDLTDNIDEERFTYLFSVDERRYFLYKGEDKVASKDGFAYSSFNSLRGIPIYPKDQLYALYTAKHLLDWYRDNQFCGRCGSRMKHSDTERCMVCECGYHSYPRIMPAVIVGVRNKDSLLLTRYRRGYGHNALIAGFVEIGETVEETVAREVMEEAGVKVKNITYYKSQPWGVANDILMGYFCDVDGEDTISMDDEELRYADWVKRGDIELQPDDISLTNEMMKLFRDGKI